jgi:hypothetical protein
MRYILAAIFVCVIVTPPASALPTVSPKALFLSKMGVVEQVAKRGKAGANRQSRSGGSGGIHPLVGSGEY